MTHLTHRQTVATRLNRILDERRTEEAGHRSAQIALAISRVETARAALRDAANELADLMSHHEATRS